nr:MAG TPA: hypothetical protein [Caudoviricetes sp.]
MIKIKLSNQTHNCFKFYSAEISKSIFSKKTFILLIHLKR